MAAGVAADEFGFNAEILGLDFALLTEHAADTEALLEAAGRLIDEEGVFALLGGFGTEQALALSALAEERQIPQGIAKRGGGAFHATTDVEALPSILSQEAMLLTDTPLEVDTFVPQWQDRSPSFLEGLPEVMPPLQGYVRTSSKDQAQLHLVGPDEDPVLASWRYGLGRVVAFASQGAGEWTRGWLELPFYPLLWSQAVRWALPPVAKPGLHLALERAGDEIRVVVEAVGERGEPAQGLQISGEVFSTSAEDQLLRLTALAPGRYQARFAVDGPGSYRVCVTSDDEVETFEAVEAETIVSYPARFAFESQVGERLRAVVHATEGRVFLGDEPLMLDLMLRYAPGFFICS